MTLLKFIDLKIAEKLKKKSYRDAFFESATRDEVANQIRVLRKKRHLRQVDLAKLTSMKQSAISRLEQAEHGSWAFSTLIRLAQALDARVKVVLQPAEEVILEYESAVPRSSDLSINEIRRSAAKTYYHVSPSWDAYEAAEAIESARHRDRPKTVRLTMIAPTLGKQNEASIHRV